MDNCPQKRLPERREAKCEAAGSRGKGIEMCARQTRLILAAAGWLAVVASPARAQEPGGAGPSIRQELVGSWQTTKPQRMIERQSGSGSCTLALKKDGKYVLAGTVTGKKTLAREFGFWSADAGKLYLRQTAFQWNRDRLEKVAGRKPSPVEYALKDGKLVVMGFIEMRRAGGAAPK